MIWTMAELIAIIVECLIVTRMLIHYFKLKSGHCRLLKWMALFLPLLATDILGSFYITNEAFLILSCLLCELVFSFVFLKGIVFEKVMISIVNYALLYFINLPVLTLVGAIADTTTSQLISSQNIERIICLFITKLLHFFATQFILWIRKKEEYHFKLNEWIIVISAFVITLLIGFAMYMITIGGRITDYVYIVVTLLLSSLDVIVFVFMRKMNIASQKEKEKALIDIQLQLQQNELRQLEHQYQEISVLRHDFRNGIDCMCGMIAQGDCAGAIAYAEQFKARKVNSIQPQIQCSSTVMNAVVNSKFSEAQAHDIDTSLRMVVQIPKYLEFDLSVLLSNLLDNAIEACLKNTVPSQILLTISEEAGYYRIVVRNTIEKSILKRNKTLKTEKTNKKIHGWGLKSVRDIVEKYNGMIDFYEKESMLYVDILLTKNDQLYLGV